MVTLYINNIAVEYKGRTFGGGEQHIYLDDFNNQSNDLVNIEMKFEGSQDIVDLMLLNNIVENKYIEYGYDAKTLTCLYLPFSRQDRITDVLEPFSLKVFADLVNSMNFNAVYTLDNHSDVGTALLNRNINRESTEFVTRVVASMFADYNTICSPDAGALKKSLKLVKALNDIGNTEYGLVKADKERNLKTGEITGTSVTGEVSGKNVLIVDDICDGGRTFIELAKVLINEGADKVSLIVTHGIFSRGTQPLYDAGIETIITTDSLVKADNNDALVMDTKTFYA